MLAAFAITALAHSDGIAFVSFIHQPHHGTVESRGYHFALANPNSGIVWAAGILGELTALDFAAPEQPVVAFHEESYGGMRQARTLEWLGPTTLLLGASSFLVLDVATRWPTLLANISTVGARSPGAPDDGLNGLLPLPGGLVAGAFMPGSVELLDTSGGGYASAGSLDLSAGAVPGMARPLGSAFDLARLDVGADGGAHVAVVSARAPADGVLQVLQLNGAGGWREVGRLHDPQQRTYCNRVRAHRGFAFFSCFGSDSVSFVDVRRPSAPRLTATVPYVDVQPTGMLLVGDALIVAGGRDFMVVNVSAPAAITNASSHVVASCGAACAPFMLTKGQNAHSLSHRLQQGRHLLFLTAQVDNNIGCVEVLDRRVIELFVAGAPARGTAPGSRDADGAL